MLVLLVITSAFCAGLLGFLFGTATGTQAGQKEGRKEMAALVEARYGPLLEQLEQFADSVDAFATQLSSEAQQQINERIEAMRKASRFN
jgi:flagellar biosynthesis/type III secretory pathway protein FliH